ncbi:septum formation initiator family protein [Streptomyces tanashiensis]|uniref:FtsB family cell division protein n=1 Tax=Streptomyces tanashiensis TaxID=67367 RepID=UPI0036E7FC10
MSTAKGPLKGRAARLGRLMPSGPSSAARTPFVLLVFVLLGGGLITLLLLNSALNQGSFQLNELKDRTTELTDEEQALQRDVDDYAAPDALERRARELGMVPGGSPAFLGPDGKVLGEPSVAVAPPPPPKPRPKPTPKPPPASATRTGTTPSTGAPGSPMGVADAAASTSTADATNTGTAPAGSTPTSPGPTGGNLARTAPGPDVPDLTQTSGR